MRLIAAVRVRPCTRGLGFCARALSSRATWLAALFLLGGCSMPLPASQVLIPYTQTWTGTATSEWLNLRGDNYQVDMRMSPPGCATRIQMVGRNEYPVVSLWPQFVPHVLNPSPAASTQWTGFSSQLVAGSYRFEGTAPAKCQWTVSIARDLSNAPARAGTCREIATLPAGSFVRISGINASSFRPIAPSRITSSWFSPITFGCRISESASTMELVRVRCFGCPDRGSRPFQR